METLHERQRFGHGTRRPERYWIGDHSGFRTLDAVDFAGLILGREVSMNDDDSAQSCERNRHLCLGDGIHRRGDDRHGQMNIAGELCRRVRFVRQHAGRRGEQHDVVERQTLDAELPMEIGRMIHTDAAA